MIADTGLKRVARLSKILLLGFLALTGVAILACSRPPSSPTLDGASTPSANQATSPPSKPNTPLANQAIPLYTYKVIASYPHDPQAFTQGLAWDGGILYEGTGMWGRSSLRRVELETGEVLQIYQLPQQFFGEGITLYQDKVIQLTWLSQTGFVYDKKSFAPVREFNYLTEGWGITSDGRRLIMSDGSATLYFLDPQTFREVGRIEVRSPDGPVSSLNELEFIQGEVLANILPTERIARINPNTGQVTAWIDLKGLLRPGEYQQPVGSLNGIAYDWENNRLFVTGKLWPKLFEIELVPATY